MLEPNRCRSGALMFVSLDRFKLVNNSLGHEAGDDILRAIADRLRDSAGPDDFVARFSGDEFVVVCEDLRLPQALAVAEGLREAVAKPLLLGGRELAPTASIGVRIFGSTDRDGDKLVTPTTLFRDAESAMYDAKDGGGNQVALFGTSAQPDILIRLDTELALRKAIDRDELVLYYQPQVSLRTGRLVGVEVLLRWPHPTRGLLAPAAFVGVAEETGLILPLGRWVLHRACEQLARWQQDGWEQARVGVNVSALQLLTGMVADLTAILDQTGANPKGLCLELTESTLLRDTTGAAAVMGALADLGVSLSIDDFGTGFFSLAYLQRLPLHQLKIDRSFVEHIDRRDERAIVSAVVGLARALYLETIAEGVEQASQQRILARLGCDAVQGYLYARPLPLDQFSPRRLEDSLVAVHSKSLEPPEPQRRTRTDWLRSDAFKTGHAHGFCSHEPTVGPCAFTNICEQCDGFVPDPDRADVIAAQLDDIRQLRDDAQRRGRTADAFRHEALIRTLERHLDTIRLHQVS